MLPLDDRNASFRPLAPRDLRDEAAGDDAGRAAIARFLRSAIAGESQRWSCGRLALAILAAFAIVIGIGILVGARLLPPRWILPTFLAAAVLVNLAFRRAAARRVAANLAVTAVASGVCGQCAYSLRNLSEEPDGCLLCPECGAAWKAVRITSSHWSGPVLRSPTLAPWIVRLLFSVPPTRQRLGPDDRGRFVPVLDSRLRALSAEHRSALGQGIITALRPHLRAIGRWKRILLALPPALIGGLLLLGAARTAIDNHRFLEETAVFLFVGTPFVLGAVLVVLGHPFYDPAAAARVFAASRRCACCAADLTGAPVAADNLAECTTCGAAWKLPR